MNKKISFLCAMLIIGLPLTAGAGLVQIGQSPSQISITTPYTNKCDEVFPHAFYEGQSFRAYETLITSTMGSSREILNATNAQIYNPFNALGNNPNSNTLGGLLPAFTYRSNGKPGTNRFSFGGIPTLLVYKQVDWTYTTKPSPNPTRANIAGQIVHDLHRQQIKSRGSPTNIYTIIGTNFSDGTTYSFTANPSDRFTPPMSGDYECQNFYIAKCGDGIQDNPNKLGNTDGKNGILVNGTLLPWTSVAPAEECDGSDGVPSGYTCNSSCKLVQTIVQPNCSLTPLQQTITCGQNAILNYATTFTNSITNLLHITGGLILPNTSSRFNVAPTQTTTYSFTANGMPGSTPVTCSATVYVNPANQPNCTLTPLQQTITAGQNAILNYTTTYTNNITNLVNISGGLVLPNASSRFNVAPTQTTTYSFTVNGGACTVPKTCTATITVLPVLPPQLRIDKSLLVDKPYHSGDLVGFRIDFKNIGSGIAHNVILTDYLPESLTYISSQLYGVTPPYNFGTGMLGPNPEIIYSGFNLAPGQAGYFIITGQLISYTLCDRTLNTSFIESSEVQPPLYDGAFFSCYNPTANLTIDKTINKQIFYPGEYINFSIAVTNNGPDVAQSVKIGDIRPNASCILPSNAWTANMPMTLTNGNNPYEWTLNTTLNVGQTVYLYLTGQVANTRSCAGNYLNTGTLTYTVNNVIRTGQDVVAFSVPLVNVSFVKSILQQGTTHGDKVVFALDYANNGTEALSSYDVTDYWPGSLTFNDAQPMPQTQTNIPGGQLLKWHFTTPLPAGGTGRIILNGTIN